MMYFVLRLSFIPDSFLIPNHIVWSDSPTITVVETLAHPIDKVYFPTVTICPQSFNSDRWGATIKVLDYIQRRCLTQG